MKKFIQVIAAIKTVACLAFTGGIMIITVASMLLGRNALPVGLIWQAVILAMLFGGLQLLSFSDAVFPRMGTPGRMALLCAAMLAVLAAFALVFRWFPAGSVTNWLVFVGLYGAVFAIAAVVLRMVFRMGGLTYTDLLMDYKTRHRKGG